MDNLPAHKVAGIREAIEAVGATFVYLSPYSPDFSPIENCWSKVKEFLRARAARTYAELDHQGHYWLVHPLLLLYSTKLRTAVTTACEYHNQGYALHSLPKSFCMIRFNQG